MKLKSKQIKMKKFIAKRDLEMDLLVTKIGLFIRLMMNNQARVIIFQRGTLSLVIKN